MPVSCQKIAFFLYLLVAISLAGAGVYYQTLSGPMPYHQEVMGTDWNRYTTGEKEMTLALLKGTGFSLIISGVSLAILILIPFQRKERWAGWAIFGIGSFTILPILVYAWYLSQAFNATTPTLPLSILYLILSAGLIFSLVKENQLSVEHK